MSNDDYWNGNERNGYGFSNNEYLIIVWITRITCTLSIIGSLLIITLFVKIPTFRKKLLSQSVLCLSIADLITALVYILPTSPDTLCSIQAAMSMASSMTSFILTDVIALVIYLTVTKPWLSIYKLENIVNYGSFLAITLSVLCTTIVVLFGKEGLSPGFGATFCWIPDQHRFWRVLGGKGIEWFSWIFVAIVYYLSTRNMMNHQAPADITTRLMFIPIAFILLRTPSAIRTIHDFFNGESHLFGLSIFQAIGDPGQGFINALCFVLWKKRLRKYVKSMICCRHDYSFENKENFELSYSETNIVTEEDELLRATHHTK